MHIGDGTGTISFCCTFVVNNKYRVALAGMPRLLTKVTVCLWKRSERVWEGGRWECVAASMYCL